VSWSLATEWFFYFAYAGGLYRLSAVTSPRVLLITALATAIGAIAANLVVYANADSVEAALMGLVKDSISRETSFGNSIFAWLVWASPYFCIWEFIAGVVAAQLYLVMRDRPGSARLGGAVFWWGLLWIAAMFLLTSDLEGKQRHLRGLGPSIVHFIELISPTFLMAPGMAMMLFGAALGRSTPTRLLSIGLIVLGGDISYSLYLGHQFVGSFATLPPGFPNVTLGLIIQLLIACVIASGMYFVIERPAKMTLRRLASSLWAPYGRQRLAE
jgi:peptidoglycan/LPS O-acetylase OafA/YrhL